MTKDELFRYQPELIRLLTNAYQKNKLVHAYLFEGNEGTGLKELAEYFSMLLLCENEEKHPCYKCNSCKRVLDHTHTNLIWIEPSNDAISKDKIESLIHEFSMTSLEGGNQISIIMDADKLNSSASNALLKFLEEPKDNHYAILITTNKNRILPTIVSRAQVLHFKPLSEEHTISCLKAQGVDLDFAFVLSEMTSDMQEAKEIIKDGNAYTIYQLVKKIVKASFEDEYMYDAYFINKNILLNQEDKKWHYFVLNLLLLIYEEMLKGDSKKYFLDILTKDVLIEKTEILKKIDILNEYQKRLNCNVNLDLFYTSLFIQL